MEINHNAFIWSEVIGAGVGILLVATIILHKHSTIIVRRYLVIFSSMFLVRCGTMLLTRLPAPALEHECKPKGIDNAWDVASATWAIWSRAGLASSVSSAF